MSRPFRTLAALAIAGLLLVGCAVPPNTAAVVNGERITETAIADAWVELAPIVAPGAQPAVAVETLVQRELLVPAAEGFGITVTQEQINEFIEFSDLAGVDPASLSPAATGVIEFLILADQVTASPLSGEILQMYLLEIERADVAVNPVYGMFTSEGRVVQVSPGWLVQPDVGEI